MNVKKRLVAVAVLAASAALAVPGAAAAAPAETASTASTVQYTFTGRATTGLGESVAPARFNARARALQNMRTFDRNNRSVRNCREVTTSYTERRTAYVLEVYATLTASCTAA